MSTLRVNTIQNVAGSGDPAINGAAKAWVNFNGTGTVAIRASFNVSSITDHGTGDYSLNFTNAFSDINYSTVFGANDAAGSGTNLGMATGKRGTAQTTTQVGVRTKYNQDGSLADMDYVFVACFR